MSPGDAFQEEFSLTQHVYDSFLQAYRDTNPLHVDDDYARERGFTERVMHGNILGGFLSYFIGKCLPVEDVMICTQTLKFSKPVYLHDTLRLDAKVKNVFDSVGITEFRFSFTAVERQEKVATGSVQILIRNEEN